jgi:hypothetical protein
VDKQFEKWLDFGADLSELAQKSMTGMTPFSTMIKPKPDSRNKEKKKRDSE